MDMATFSTSYLPTTGFQPQLGRSVTIDQAAGLLGVSRQALNKRLRRRQPSAGLPEETHSANHLR